MYAVLKTGGKQYRVAEGDVISVEKLNGDVGGTVLFDEILMIGDGDSYKIGTPTLSDARVKGVILDQEKGKKIIVFKSKRRKGSMTKKGHRQKLTKLQIKEING
jgi:large subunit ribosomal protein L21